MLEWLHSYLHRYLGPLLFLLCINDICNVSDKFKLILFADDTTILGTLKNTIIIYTSE